MKLAKKISSIAFLLGLLAILSSVYFAVTGDVIMTQLFVFVGLILVTIALFGALLVITKEIQRVKTLPAPPEPAGSIMGDMVEILFYAILYR